MALALVWPAAHGQQRRRAVAARAQARALVRAQRAQWLAARRVQAALVAPGAVARIPAPAGRRFLRQSSDPNVVRLLRRMLRPTVDYAGVQVTERGSLVSRQRIEGDTRGRVRREFLEPPGLAGDVMITGPVQYRFYHRRTNTVDVALWPTQWNQHEERMFALISSGRVSAAIVGQESIAGRAGTIVSLNAASRQMKYWIDPETGIQLKNEIVGPTGLESRSYMESLSTGPQAGVQPRDFEQAFPSAAENPLFPEGGLPSIEAARPRLNFAPVVPAALPPGYHLSGVWVFGPQANRETRQQSLLLRYTDGVSNFSLYERVPGPNAQSPRTGPALFRRPIQRWRVTAPDGERLIVYVGHLSAAEAQAVYASLR